MLGFLRSESGELIMFSRDNSEVGGTEWELVVVVPVVWRCVNESKRRERKEERIKSGTVWKTLANR
jgi:hypothetical protein